MSLTSAEVDQIRIAADGLPRSVEDEHTGPAADEVNGAEGVEKEEVDVWSDPIWNVGTEGAAVSSVDGTGGESKTQDLLYK